jgi:flagellar motility protein MotE (MotC chaperone)
MRGKHPPIGYYVQVTLLCFLIAKVVLTSILVCTRSPALPVPILATSPAFAKGDKGKAPEGDSSDPPLSAKPHASREAVTEKISLEALEQKRAQIEKQRLLLEKEQERLTELKQEFDAKLLRLKQLQNDIQSKLEQQKTVQDARIKHLIKIYTTMPPKKAGTLIEKLDMEVIIALFSGMKGESVGRILPHVSAEKAAKISERLATMAL